MKSQSCSSSFGVRKGKDTCQVLYHGQSSDTPVTWTSSCGGTAETMNDGVSDVITFTCTSKTTGKPSEKPVQSNFGQSVAAAAKSTGMMKSGMAVGKSFSALGGYDKFLCMFLGYKPINATCQIAKNGCKGRTECTLKCPKNTVAGREPIVNNKSYYTNSCYLLISQ